MGRRVAGRNPGRSEVDGRVSEPDEAWRKVVLRLDTPAGERFDIELLRPLAWIEAYGVEAGTTIPLALSEAEVEGRTEVLAIEPCPPIQPGLGQVVTGRFAHTARETIDVCLAGLAKPIGCTPGHPFWSVDREEFVEAGRLEIGGACP